MDKEELGVMRTKSGRIVRPGVIRVIMDQTSKYDEALEEVEEMRRDLDDVDSTARPQQASQPELER